VFRSASGRLRSPPTTRRSAGAKRDGKWRGEERGPWPRSPCHTPTAAANDATNGRARDDYRPSDVGKHCGWRDGHGRRDLRSEWGWSVSRRDSSVAGNDAPLVGERAATRGRSATEGGDEPVRCERRHPLALQFASARGERRDQGRAHSSVRSAVHFAHHDAPFVGERDAPLQNVLSVCAPTVDHILQAARSRDPPAATNLDAGQFSLTVQSPHALFVVAFCSDSGLFCGNYCNLNLDMWHLLRIKVMG
jgi:hypothetical protein